VPSMRRACGSSTRGSTRGRAGRPRGARASGGGAALAATATPTRTSARPRRPMFVNIAAADAAERRADVSQLAPVQGCRGTARMSLPLSGTLKSLTVSSGGRGV